MSLKSPADCDVAVVGFGPTGSVAAALLAQEGFKVLVIDKSAEIYPKPRAISIDHEIMRVFQQLGLAEAVSAFVEPFTASEHFGADGQMIRRLSMVEPPYPMGWIPSMVFLQPPMEKLLRDHVQFMPSAHVVLGSELSDLQQTPDIARLTVVDSDGQSKTVSARYVVACDGASSTVRRLLDLPLDDLDFDEPWLVVDVRVNEGETPATLPFCSAQFCEPGRPISYIVGVGNHRRWEIMLLPGEDPEAMLADARIWALLARWINPTQGTLWRKAAYRFHALVAKEWRKDRVFLAGDAAHQQPPFLGQGMCQGIRDAANLCWKLTHVLRNGANDALLDSYGTERGAHVRALTTTIKGIGRYICERDVDAARARDAKLLHDQGGAVKSVPRQDLIPGVNAGFFSEPFASSVGRLFIQPKVLDSGVQRLMDDVHGCGWRVVTTDNNLAHSIDEALAEAKDLLGFELSVIHLDGNDPVVSTWNEKFECPAVLVRPDHYVYAALQSVDDVKRELKRVSEFLKGRVS